MVFSLAACGGGGDTSPSPDAATEAPADDAAAEPEAPADDAAAEAAPAAEAASGEAKHMTMVTDVGGVNDESFNMLAWQGHEKAGAELGLEVDYIESSQESDYAPNMETAYDNGARMIWGIGFLMADTVMSAAEKNPDAMYAIIDNTYDPATMPSNLIGIAFREQEPSFMVGYIAAKMSKSGKIGFVGGMENEVIIRFEAGYTAGAKFANPDVEVMINYVGNFNDSAQGKAIAQNQILGGADIIFHAAGASGNGAIEACKETGSPADGGIWAIGVDTDQNKLAPDNVLTSACKAVDEAILIVARDYAAGTVTGGDNKLFGYAEDGVSIALTGDHVPADIQAEVDALIQQVKDGSLVIPGTREEIDGFLSANAA